MHINLCLKSHVRVQARGVREAKRLNSPQILQPTERDGAFESMECDRELACFVTPWARKGCLKCQSHE